MAFSKWSGHPERAFLASHEEDRFSELLGQLLMAPPVLEQFLKQLRGLKLPPQELGSAVVSTQEIDPDGRLDLVIRSSKNLQVFVAKLTSWQPGDRLMRHVRYVEQWRADHPTGRASLVILTPQASLASAVTAAQAELKEGSDSPPVDLAKLSWEQVADTLQSLAPTMSDMRLKEHLELFADLIAYRLGPALRPFTRREIELLNDPAAGQAIFMATKVVEQTALALKDNWWLPKKLSLALATGSNEQFHKGYSFWVDKKEFWFGVWIESWLTCGAPICLQSYAFTVAKSALPDLTKLRIPQGIEYQIVPLPLLADVEIGQQAQRLSEMIQSIVEKVI